MEYASEKALLHLFFRGLELADDGRKTAERSSMPLKQAKRLKFGNRPFRHQKRTGVHA
jgi:hypothetical protein